MDLGKLALGAVAIHRFLTFSTLLCLLPANHATDALKWDFIDNGTAIDEGPGTWDTSTKNWNNGTGSVLWTPGSDAIFGASGTAGSTPHLVTFDSFSPSDNITANTIKFQSGHYKVENPNASRMITLNGGTIEVVGGVVGTIDAKIKTSGGFSKLGEGTLEIVKNGHFDAGGLVTVSAGELHLKAGSDPSGLNAISVNGLTINGETAGVTLFHNNQVNNDASVSILNGSLNLSTWNDTIRTLNLESGSLQGSGILTVSGDGAAINAQSGTIEAKLAGTAPLTKTGGGTVTLSGANSYSGGTTLTEGTLKLASPTALPTSGNVIMNGGTLEINNQNVTSSRTLGALTLQADSLIVLEPNGSITFNTAVRNAGKLSISGYTVASGGDGIFINNNPGSFPEFVQFYDAANNPVGLGSVWDPNSHQLSPDMAAAPEPTTVALGIFGGIFGVVTGVRRYVRSRR